MDNGTMEVSTSLGLVGGGAAAGTLAGSVAGPVGGVIGAVLGAVAGGIVGRRVGRLIVGPPKMRNRSLGEVLGIATRADTKEIPTYDDGFHESSRRDMLITRTGGK